MSIMEDAFGEYTGDPYTYRWEIEGKDPLGLAHVILDQHELIEHLENQLNDARGLAHDMNLVAFNLARKLRDALDERAEAT